MATAPLPLLRFEEAYFQRIWGGQKLRTLFGKPIPSDRPVGEAWLISDHDVHESRVATGPLAGQTLRQLLARDAVAVLGSRAALTVHGRFPLLLKVLDASDVLSVQVHPDDKRARELGENDVGKTEMWHVLHADPGSELICGLDPAVTAELFRAAVAASSLEPLMQRFEVQPGASVFVPAGTVHAIGKGIVLAEIQQNSDLTYRVYDWGRVQADGKPRELHIEKSIAATHFGESHPGLSPTLSYSYGGGQRTVLAACRYFAAERIEAPNGRQIVTRGESFYIVFASENRVQISAANGQVDLNAGAAVLVPGSVEAFEVSTVTSALLYYVPNIEVDIVGPLSGAGHTDGAIASLVSLETRR